MSRTLQLGAHVGQQNMSMDEMRALWRKFDQGGMEWLSLWDHLYEAPPADGTVPHFEAVASLGAMAAETQNARLGCFVFYVGYRNPGLLAKAAVTIDHISGGRFEIGLGAGWHEWEAQAFGYDFPSLGTRFDMLEEATPLMRSFFTNERTATLAIADGENVWALRWSSDKYVPSLFLSHTSNGALAVSEPIDEDVSSWAVVPENSLMCLTLKDHGVTVDSLTSFI